jgi:hypothetical protein
MTAEVSHQSGPSSGLVSITTTLGEPGDAAADERHLVHRD